MKFVLSWRKSIRLKLIPLFLLTLIIPVSALGVVSYRIYDDESGRLIEKNLKNLVNMAASITEGFENEAAGGRMDEAEAQEYVKEQLIGAKSGDTRAITKAFDLGENGYFFILNEKGDLLGHPLLEGQNIIDKKTSSGFYYIQDMIAKSKQGGGFTLYDWPLPNSEKEAQKITYALQVPGEWGWIVAAGSYMKDYNAGEGHILNAIWITVAVCWLLFAPFLFLLIRSIVTPIKRITSEAARMADGDLSRLDLAVRNRDEIGELARSFVRMHDNLRDIVGALLANADRLNAASNNMSLAVSETTQAGKQVALAAQEIASGNETQARAAAESSQSMEEMTQGIQRIADTSSEAFDSSETTLFEAAEGNRLLRSTDGKMGTISETTERLSGILARLTERSSQIGGVAEAIAELASQTNLLALNASIEAARAGEEGKGFAVVAAEVKKLAQRSSDSAGEVAELIRTVRSDVTEAGATMELNQTAVEAGVQALKLTGESFAAIVKATQSVATQIQESSSSAQQMAASSEEMAASMQEMDRISSHANELAQTISAASEEQLAEMEALSASADSLRDLASDLQRMAHKFKL
ncbi:methyl-accepting chemotaxis protein [Cohnella rhizosphaerae]|uniref:Methyl-accepting chemotaxis protein n=1 Tax=Cohnella rhizosphaerae TaxID=1457232 RepID=A0A9X4KQD2_9BACL|nr:methyl-accepting chemotaxis protein [Cohnella rhizosphaerae]MDG0808306.1 methyl-accepting chemotaxis protein [Cohnella rhizosphaerae]